MQYLSDAKHQVKTAGVGLALKKGTKNNLGLVGITLKSGDEGLIRKRWVVRGAPNMTPSTFQEFLKKKIGGASMKFSTQMDVMGFGSSRGFPRLIFPRLALLGIMEILLR